MAKACGRLLRPSFLSGYEKPLWYYLGEQLPPKEVHTNLSLQWWKTERKGRCNTLSVLFLWKSCCVDLHFRFLCFMLQPAWNDNKEINKNLTKETLFSFSASAMLLEWPRLSCNIQNKMVALRYVCFCERQIIQCKFTLPWIDLS